MEQPKYLIDTNAVIDFLGNKIPGSGMKFMGNVIDLIPNISVITKIEVLGFKTFDEHYQLLSDFINDSNLFLLSENVINASIEIRKNHKTKLPDAIIAATALVNNFVIISRNHKDFQNIMGLNCINPYDIS